MLNENGYHRPSYEEILESKEQSARALFGEDIDTSEQTALGKFIRIGAYDLAKAYEDLEAIYYARFPNTAQGVSLDRLCVFAGISRNPATRSEYTLTVHGEPGAEIADIKVCGRDSEITFHNVEIFTIGEDGTAEVVVECDIAGKIGNGIVINEIVNPIADVDRISDSVQIELGEDIESDVSLRSRFSQAIEGFGGCNTNSIRSAILRVATVKSVSIIENNENVEDENGRPPHSFECYVYGGEDHEQEIAQAIYDHKAIGIKACTTSEGDNAITTAVLDAGGTSHSISFSRTENVPIYILVNYKTNNRFESDGETQIKDGLAEYVNGLGVGAEVVYSSLFTHIYNVVGVRDVTSLTIGVTEESTSTSNISVKEWQIPFTDATKIILNNVTEG